MDHPNRLMDGRPRTQRPFHSHDLRIGVNGNSFFSEPVVTADQTDGNIVLPSQQSIQIILTHRSTVDADLGERRSVDGVGQHAMSSGTRVISDQKQSIPRTAIKAAHHTKQARLSRDQARTRMQLFQQDIVVLPMPVSHPYLGSSAFQCTFDGGIDFSCHEQPRPFVLARSGARLLRAHNPADTFNIRRN